ncbi:DUF2339 domain-containing protein [Mycobacterium sp. M1]|uniref:DUF2339 domain-containing protein n=1 Tax=Mycolicibacter acidiphilus TaxID=2835306 RepID=A0ABS5RQ03_9MYCO|nr:DUF2339 domain-containing protein [Mycolicibacter acidiphilus]MBS9536097.1 DUF2339 domain-containing protein [Mycolicibacter acidiphilus]
MTEPHRAVINRLSAELQAMSWQLYRVSSDLAELDRQLSAGTHRVPVAAPVVARPVPPVAAQPPVTPQPAPQPAAGPAPQPWPAQDDPGWIGKLLAVAGVAVTLVGVVLLLVLAAQAGLLSAPIRVAGGAALAAGLVAVAHRLRGRPGGRTGAIALAATGIAAAYLDVVAISTVYHWVPAAVGLVLAAAVGGAGLTLARRWDSEHLGLLVLTPLIGLAPFITGDVDLTLVAFLLALSAAVLPVQLGRDWIWLSAVRVAAPTLPLLVTLTGNEPWPVGLACVAGAILAIAGGLVLMPATSRPGVTALLMAAGTVPLLAIGVAVPPAAATALIAILAAVLLTIALKVRGLPRDAAQILGGSAAVAALVAAITAFRGPVLAPVLLAMAVVVAVAGRTSAVARWAAIGFGAIGVAVLIGHATPGMLLTATVVPLSQALSTLAGAVLTIVLIALLVRGHRVPDAGVLREREDISLLAGLGGLLIVYTTTAFTVTAGVLIGGTGGGFLAGHMAATICWIALAAWLFRYALRSADADDRPLPITAGLMLTGAATAKLFLFDLGTLNGMFRVGAFIVVGLMLLGMGTGYARELAQNGDRSK